MKFDVRTFNGWNTEGSGCHSVELVMSVVGEKGAIVWRLALGLVPRGFHSFGDSDFIQCYQINHSVPTDMGLCAHAELTEETAHAENISETCEHLEGRACCSEYITGLTGLLPVFVSEGFPGVERELRQRYEEYYGELK